MTIYTGRLFLAGLKINSMTLEDYYHKVGEWLGYPNCCIDAFIERAIADREIPLTAQQKAVHGSRGFIPCPVCAETVTEETIENLIKDRKCPTPFPNCTITAIRKYIREFE